MRILLIPPIYQNAYQAPPDLGIGYLATALRKSKYTVFVSDCIDKRTIERRFNRELNLIKPDVVGFKLFTMDLEIAKVCFQIVKRYNHRIKIIIGGYFPSSYQQKSLSYFPEVDFGFKGEAEIGLPLLLRYLDQPESENLSSIPGLIYRDKEKILSNPPMHLEDIDSLGFPSWDLIDPRKYNYQSYLFTKNKTVAPLVSGRGCPSRCKFCSYGAVTGKQARVHSAKYLIDQIKFLYKNFGVRELHFVNEHLITNKDIFEEFCYTKIKQRLNIDWTCFCRLDTLDKRTLKLMEKSGCYSITVGIESGSRRVLEHMQKDLTIETIREKLHLIKDNTKIMVMGTFILGYPIENQIDIQKTIEFSKSLPLFASTFYHFFLVPGTPIYNELIAKEKPNADWSKFLWDRDPYIPNSIGYKKLKKLYQKAYMSFYFRPKILFRILIKIRSFGNINFLIKKMIIILKKQL